MEEKTISIYENFLSEELFKKCQEYADYLLYTQSVCKTNYVWNENIRKDSTPIIIHTLDCNNDIYIELKNVICEKIKYINELKFVMFYNYTPMSHIPWHDDGFHEGGITIYLNETWDIDNGGAFLFGEPNRQVFNAIYPYRNLAVCQRGGILHSVSPLSNTSQIRKTIQIFF